MKSEKPDRRVKYTKMVLKQSLLELMADRPISQITIKEICDLADVNRGTFYKHYDDQFALLSETQDELAFEMKVTSEKRLMDSSSAIEILTEIFRCIAAKSTLCKILCSDYGDGEFLKKIMYVAHDQFIEEWQTKLKQSDRSQLDKFYTYTANGIIAVTQDWLQNGIDESPEDIALFIEKTINYGLSHLVDGI